jgi:hypothetical protein
LPIIANRRDLLLRLLLDGKLVLLWARRCLMGLVLLLRLRLRLPLLLGWSLCIRLSVGPVCRLLCGWRMRTKSLMWRLRRWTHVWRWSLARHLIWGMCRWGRSRRSSISKCLVWAHAIRWLLSRCRILCRLLMASPLLPLIVLLLLRLLVPLRVSFRFWWWRRRSSYRLWGAREIRLNRYTLAFRHRPSMTVTLGVCLRRRRHIRLIPSLRRHRRTLQSKQNQFLHLI